MPQISYFFGISVYVQYLDHNPPHIHTVYQGFKASYLIDDASIIAGKMSPRANKLIQEWILLNKNELMEDWELAKLGKKPFAISPLE